MWPTTARRHMYTSSPSSSPLAIHTECIQQQTHTSKIYGRESGVEEWRRMSEWRGERREGPRHQVQGPRHQGTSVEKANAAAETVARHMCE